ncbi:glutathione peroxidase [Clostridium sp. D2Q-11]|uniref:Glutathione peroxidase n=1 Tax=Anaeromonas frigoriresistens TaxID=2683708 RepID=A0A942UXK3_9FIRM|nr:glutathione peroxidase [Anaeromonas frigoriresistens]MBS4539425.1 glutathione peroxidase [Anaeromonas frigoriresistens]
MNIYDFTANDINGNPVSLQDYKGKVIIIVNTASKCDFTPQYEDLQKLYDKYHSQGLEILGFPCNQFMEQEPGNSADIKSFCDLQYGVTFPIFEKIKVNGKFAHPLFKYLKESTTFDGLDMKNSSNKILDAILKEKFPEFTTGNSIRWNFTKFLVDKNGNIVKRFESAISPMELEPYIKKEI